MRTIRAYRTVDGRVFEDEREAGFLVYAWCNEHGIGRGGEWDAEMVANEIIGHAEELGDILAAYKQARQPTSAHDDDEILVEELANDH